MKNLTTLFFCVSFAFTFAQDLELELFASGFDRVVNMKHAGDERLFIVEQDGIIKILNADSTAQSANFLNIDPIVRSTGNEQGLLGLAFHPDYATNGYFFVYYTNNSGNSVISRFSRIGISPEIADPNSELEILSFPQPFSNHNGGELQFGPDGYLYISSGDGGSGGDPQNNSQNLTNFLGKLIRIDVNNSTVAEPYAIPADNPFVGNSTALDEIWAYGLRNAWKFSFDRMNDDLWIADVGQSAREEINRVEFANAGLGLNYGWRCYEGNLTFNTSGCPSISTLTFPVSEYAHTGGRCSITGGYVYRGTAYPNLVGKYFFADVCTQEIGYLELIGGNWVSTFENFSGGFVAFGEDVNGELFVSTLGGNVFRLTDTLLSVDENTLSSVSIFPNPAKDVLNIDFSNYSTSASIEISIYDIQGKNVKSTIYNGNSTETLNLSDLKSGFYILKIESENGEQITEKLVIN